MREGLTIPSWFRPSLPKTPARQTAQNSPGEVLKAPEQEISVLSECVIAPSTR